MNELKEYLPLLIPVIIIIYGLQIAALIDIFKHTNYKNGNRVMWVLISFIQIIGPVIYFVFGKED